MRFNKITATTLIILSLNSIACGTISVPTAKEAAVLDTVTTAAVLVTETGHETNPVGFAGATLAKVLILNNLHRFEPESQDRIKRVTATIWTAAAVNNLAVLMCIPLSVSLPLTLAAGYVVYKNTPVRKKTKS
jgi:hypothetical protein